MNWNDGITPYKIETDRLIIKCWEPKYAQKLKAEIEESADVLLPWMPFAKAPFPTLIEEINTLRTFRGNYDLNKDYVLGIFDKAEEIVIGSTGLHTRQGPNTFEIGYWIGKRHQNKGYATEVTSSLIKLSFEYSNVIRIEINSAYENTKSENVIKKLNIQFEGVIRKGIVDAYGKYHDLKKWAILREEYEKSEHKKRMIKAYDCTGNLIE